MYHHLWNFNLFHACSGTASATRYRPWNCLSPILLEPSENRKSKTWTLQTQKEWFKYMMYLHSHYQKFKPGGTGRNSYLHPDYLSRIFKKETGMNLNRYIKTFRLNQACRQLETTQQKITAISASVGYQNCAYFIRSFTEHFGISPEKYRQQHNQFSGGKSL